MFAPTLKNMPKTKKQKDFEKQKLKVGKKKPERSNATNTSFQTKTLVLQSQLKGPSLSTYLALVRHHQAPTRRQALANIGDVIHLHEQESSEILKSVASLMVDADHQVRLALLGFLKKLDQRTLSSNISLLAVHVHAAMTHITPAIRADSTLFLDFLVLKCPDELVRSCFTKTLELYFPLLGWPTAGKTQSGIVSATLSLGKLAPKARAQQLQSLFSLLNVGLKPPRKQEPLLYHPDTAKFLIPFVSNPFESDVTDDVEARMEAVDKVRVPLVRGLDSCSKEGGETGRVAARILGLLEE